MQKTDAIDTGTYPYLVIWNDMGTRSLHVFAESAADAKRKAKIFNNHRGTDYTTKRQR